MAMGSIGKILRELSEQERAMIAHGWQHCAGNTERYRVELRVEA